MHDIVSMNKWQCSECNAWNPLSTDTCNHCGYKVPTDKVPKVVL